MVYYHVDKYKQLYLITNIPHTPRIDIQLIVLHYNYDN